MAKGKLTFPSSFEKRLENVRAKARARGDNRTDSELVRAGLKLYEALLDPNTTITARGGKIIIRRRRRKSLRKKRK